MQLFWLATLRIMTVNFIEVIEMIIEIDLNVKEYAIIFLTMDMHCRFGHKCKYRHTSHSISLEFDFKTHKRQI